MLLREFVVEDHVISLIQDNDIYIAKVTNKDNERVLYNEYKDYEKVKNSFDEIVQAIEANNINIKDVIEILERNQV